MTVFPCALCISREQLILPSWAGVSTGTRERAALRLVQFGNICAAAGAGPQGSGESNIWPAVFCASMESRQHREWH